MDILDRFYNEFDEIDFEKLFMFLDNGCIGCEQKETAINGNVTRL